MRRLKAKLNLKTDTLHLFFEKNSGLKNLEQSSKASQTTDVRSQNDYINT